MSSTSRHTPSAHASGGGAVSPEVLSSVHAAAPAISRLDRIRVRFMMKGSWFECSFEAELDAPDDGHADLVGEDLDAVLGADRAPIEEVAARELDPHVARQRLAHGQVEPVERLLVDVALTAGADLLDPPAERVVEQ